ncbi:transglutaminase domain-containing protein [Pseudocnuella soli]|uniref:transglutaminase domain-containing protein n=1 Tax=Pseudocnuella soli TaxID=2502779 RepID=UPI0010494EA8|nr:transglutaminase domain-containing protein [Pseudocnuella soli]
MRFAFFIFFIGLCCNGALAQKAPSAAARLAHELTRNSKTERQKADAIFYWITGNISYKVSGPFAATRSRRQQSNFEDDDTSTVLPPLDQRVAELVLQKGEAVCDGYARLFKVLCDHAGLEAVVINGYARTGSGSQGRFFRANHSWNAVRIDSIWYLLDATWASGFTNMRGDQFFRQFDSRYYLADPQSFIRDHYPEDPGWTLLPDQPLIREFQQTPFKHTSFVRQQIKSFSPAIGIIEAAVGDTVLIELETFEPEKKMEVWDQPFGDPRRHTGPVWRNYPEKPPLVNGARVGYTYVVHSPQVQWLYVVLNGESVLQYRLNIKQPLAAARNKEAAH